MSETQKEGYEQKVAAAACPVIDIWEILGKRWSLFILKNLSTKETIRFNELKRALSGISSTVLSERLLELEREGLVSKKIYPEVPPRVEYSMTPQAKELEVVIKELGRWVSRWKRPEVATVQPAKKEEAAKAS
ncbi:MAG: winged helix-turn-helix transcriptional regulator [Nitrososphaera sp.]|uniref:winged helix-turn-helix transcriptional regulator n=1 Tax=Nitrososphaera sp. TaxID=1971748 RepID=UPI003D6FACFD